MRSLLIFLLFCPLIYSAAISLGTLSEYNGKTEDQHPSECFSKAHNVGYIFDRSDPKPLTDEQMKEKLQVLKKCISDMALINPKVKKVEKPLITKMIDLFNFRHQEMISCGRKLKSQLYENECYKSTGLKRGDYFCNDIWGKDGCMIKIYQEYCDEGMVDRLKDMALFHSSRQKECVDKYFG